MTNQNTPFCNVIQQLLWYPQMPGLFAFQLEQGEFWPLSLAPDCTQFHVSIKLSSQGSEPKQLLLYLISGHVNSLDRLTLRTLLESNGRGNLRQIRPILDKTIIALPPPSNCLQTFIVAANRELKYGYRVNYRDVLKYFRNKKKDKPYILRNIALIFYCSKRDYCEFTECVYFTETLTI